MSLRIVISTPSPQPTCTSKHHPSHHDYPPITIHPHGWRNRQKHFTGATFSHRCRFAPPLPLLACKSMDPAPGAHEGYTTRKDGLALVPPPPSPTKSRPLSSPEPKPTSQRRRGGPYAFASSLLSRPNRPARHLERSQAIPQQRAPSPSRPPRQSLSRWAGGPHHDRDRNQQSCIHPLLLRFLSIRPLRLGI